MVIERALEKLRQSGGELGRAHPHYPHADTARVGALAPELRQIERPVLPHLQVDEKAVEAARVLLPGSKTYQDGRVSAAYRMLRTRFLQKLRANRWSSLAITSPGPGEGKSLTALNLALSLARDKTSDVFLLDLDMRNPSVCRYLGVDPPHSLVTYFAGEGKPADVLFSIGVENLALAGSNISTDQASELIAIGRLEELLHYIRTIATSPIILIDLPPLLVTDDALVVAPRVDATALVVAEGRTRRDSLARAKQLLADFTFAGVILNCSTEDFGADSYGYGAHYSRYEVAKS